MLDCHLGMIAEHKSVAEVEEEEIKNHDQNFAISWCDFEMGSHVRWRLLLHDEYGCRAGNKRTPVLRFLWNGSYKKLRDRN